MGSSLGAFVGLINGCGLALVIARIPWWRMPSLEERLAPYVNDVPPVSGLLGAGAPRRPWVVLERILAPVMDDLVRWAEQVTGGPQTVTRRLTRLGVPDGLRDFRADQVLWGLLGAAGGLAVGLVTGWGRIDGAVRVLALILVGALIGVLARDQQLTRDVNRREARMLEELPTIAELLALAVGAGEGAAGALDRIGRTCSGELATEVRRVMAEVRAGDQLVQALVGLAARTGLAQLARFVDGIAVAVDRGTPLAEVLRAQAGDVRDLSRRRLVEIGGRKEVTMMAPVVFLILPVTVLFAVYPGLAILDLNL